MPLGVARTRYQFRVADHLQAIADAMDFFFADERLPKTMLESFSPKHISFGKDSATPVQDMVALARESVVVTAEKGR
jgi:hypothetical protein